MVIIATSIGEREDMLQNVLQWDLEVIRVVFYE